MTILQNVDYVTPSLPPLRNLARLLVMEDNEEVIKMTCKGRSPNKRHVARTQRVDLDWLFQRFREDPGLRMKYVGTKEQIVDILTKGAFAADTW